MSGTVYTVKSGDTLGAIAEHNHTTVSAILKANPSIKNANSIAVGQKIHIPGKHASGGGSTSTPKPHSAPHEDSKHHGSLIFPLWIKPSASWKTSPRYFGSPRSGGRLHAGCDLYAPFGSKIRAIAEGIIIQPPYFFYDGTNALEVFHPGVGVVRYGEISSSRPVHVRAGQKVKVGEHIANVGLLDSLQMSMIHFELYGESARGQALTTYSGPYKRNSALKNPTALIDKLYKKTFG